MAVKLVKKAFRNELIFCVFINKGRKGDGTWNFDNMRQTTWGNAE